MDRETGTLYAHRAVDYEQHKMLKVGLARISASVGYTAVEISSFCRCFLALSNRSN